MSNDNTPSNQDKFDDLDHDPLEELQKILSGEDPFKDLEEKLQARRQSLQDSEEVGQDVDHVQQDDSVDTDGDLDSRLDALEKEFSAVFDVEENKEQDYPQVDPDEYAENTPDDDFSVQNMRPPVYDDPDGDVPDQGGDIFETPESHGGYQGHYTDEHVDEALDALERQFSSDVMPADQGVSSDDVLYQKLQGVLSDAADELRSPSGITSEQEDQLPLEKPDREVSSVGNLDDQVQSDDVSDRASDTHMANSLGAMQITSGAGAGVASFSAVSKTAVSSTHDDDLSDPDDEELALQSEFAPLIAERKLRSSSHLSSRRPLWLLLGSVALLGLGYLGYNTVTSDGAQQGEVVTIARGDDPVKILPDESADGSTSDEELTLEERLQNSNGFSDERVVVKSNEQLLLAPEDIVTRQQDGSSGSALIEAPNATVEIGAEPRVVLPYEVNTFPQSKDSETLTQVDSATGVEQNSDGSVFSSAFSNVAGVPAQQVALVDPQTGETPVVTDDVIDRTGLKADDGTLLPPIAGRPDGLGVNDPDAARLAQEARQERALAEQRVREERLAREAALRDQAQQSASQTGSAPVSLDRLVGGAQQSTEQSALTSASASSSSGGFLVQLASQRSSEAARDSFNTLQRRFASVIGGVAPVIKSVDLGSRGTYYRAYAGPYASRDAAIRVCEGIKAQGGDCLIQSN